MITLFQKKLFYLIVIVPFYAHAIEEQKQLAAEWTFTIKRTSPNATAEWQTLLAKYSVAATTLLPKAELEELLKEIQNLPVPTLTPDFPCKINEATLQPFVGQRLAAFLAQETNGHGIHGNLLISLDENNAAISRELTWTMELRTDKQYSNDMFEKLISELRALTQELNENTVASDNLNFGSLLHGVAQQSVAGAPYTCHASLTLHT